MDGSKTHSNKVCDTRREHISPWQVSHHHRSTSTDTLFSVTFFHDVQLHLAVSRQAKARVISQHPHGYELKSKWILADARTAMKKLKLTLVDPIEYTLTSAIGTRRMMSWHSDVMTRTPSTSEERKTWFSMRRDPRKRDPSGEFSLKSINIMHRRRPRNRNDLTVGVFHPVPVRPNL